MGLGLVLRGLHFAQFLAEIGDNGAVVISHLYFYPKCGTQLTDLVLLVFNRLLAPVTARFSDIVTYNEIKFF